MFLGMTLWFSATAANAPIIAEFHLSAGETLTMASRRRQSRGQ